jgi:vacuolar protein sorting-associated protein 35
MLRELRTSLLNPKSYYELYMKVLDELRELEEYFSSLQRSGQKIVELYEQVQACSQILPRLYLLICVGGVYIDSREAPAKDILKDLIEMTKGIQHPTRGLFLRNYLSHVTKNRLPDSGSPFEGSGGNVEDAYEFVLQNFTETNRLWVRLQNQGAKADRKRREKERQDLRILVGTNLVRLSQLEGLDLPAYKAIVLPRILEQVILCKDTIAQTYLMDCTIQVFPDEFHLATLEPFLQACGNLKEKVNVRGILESMMDRLAYYAAHNAGQIPAEVQAFKMFNDCVTNLIDTRTNLTLTETLKLQTAMTTFSLKCYPSRLDYVSHCLAASVALIDKSDYSSTLSAEGLGSNKSLNETTAQIEALLSAPLSTLALRVLDLPQYAKLMSFLPWGNWKEVAASLLKSVVARNSPLSDVDQAEQLFAIITPLLKDKEGTRREGDEEGANVPVDDAFKEEQLLVAKVVHLMQNDDTDLLLKLYVSARTKFISGGAQRIQFTLVPLVFAALSLAKRVLAREQAAAAEQDTPPQFSTRKVFQFIIEIVTAMATSHPEISMKLFLQSAQAADACNFSAIAYEFVKEGLLIYECEISDSKAQVRALTGIIGTLLNCKNFPTEDYEALITKTAQYANKLLKKPDQCRMVSLCSHLFWPKDNPIVPADGEGEVVIPPQRYADCDRVLECMQRSLKIASVCNPNLFVEILDRSVIFRSLSLLPFLASPSPLAPLLSRYIFYFENNNPVIHVRYLSGLIALIHEQMGTDEQQMGSAVRAHYRNTLGRHPSITHSLC